MHQIISKLLLVSIILSGTILPVLAYAHSGNLNDTEQHESIDVADKHGHEQDTSCDHCCHFFAHSVGMFNDNTGMTWCSSDNLLTPYSRLYHYLTTAPPSPPPIFS